MKMFIIILYLPKDFTNILSQPLPSLTIGYTLESPVGSPVSSEAQHAVMDAVAFLKDHRFFKRSSF